MTSLRRTALIWMTTLLSVVGVLAFFVTYEVARREAADFLDGQLRQIALNAGQGISEVNTTLYKHDPEDEFVIEIWNSAGESLRSSTNGAAISRQSEPGYATIHVGDEDWRVYLASDGSRFVQVAQRMSVRQEMAAAAAIQAGAPILIVIPLTWLAIGYALGQVLGRLTTLAARIADHGVDSQVQIPVIGIPAEIRPLVEAMNVLTHRMQQTIAQQKRFVSDAAHELRTPLTALHIQLENLRASGPDPQSPQLSELRDGVNRATALVEQLLRLARSEQPLEQMRWERVDLCVVVMQSMADFVPMSAAKGIDLGMAACDEADIPGSPADLKILFHNLIDNAIRYTPPGGSIDVSVLRKGKSINIEIVDTGCGVAVADIPRLCDPFFRAPVLDVEGSGLGLSIAAAVAKRHGLVISIENRRDQTGLRVRVTNSPVNAPEYLS